MYQKLLETFNLLNVPSIQREIDYEEAVRRYEKSNYAIDETVDTFIKIFVNKKVKQPTLGEEYYIDFRFRQVLKDYPPIVIKRYAEKFCLEGLIPLAETHNGYILIVVDQMYHVYGIFDNLLLLYGTTIEEGFVNIYKNKELKRITE